MTQPMLGPDGHPAPPALAAGAGVSCDLEGPYLLFFPRGAGSGADKIRLSTEEVARLAFSALEYLRVKATVLDRTVAAISAGGA